MNVFRRSTIFWVEEVKTKKKWMRIFLYKKISEEKKKKNFNKMYIRGGQTFFRAGQSSLKNSIAGRKNFFLAYVSLSVS